MPTPVVFQGERGAYSEEAARAYFGDRADIELVPKESWLEVVHALAEGADRRAVLPIENTMVGTFAPVADLFARHRPWIVGEVVIPIRHALIVHPGADLEDLVRVVAHPETLDVCRDLILDRDLDVVPTTDTALAVRCLKEDHGPDTAAIASPAAAKVHGMEVAVEDLKEKEGNLARFFVVTRYKRDVPDDADKTTLGFSVPDKPGALHGALACFAKRDINIARLDVRPKPGQAFQYTFVADIPGSTEEDHVAEALQELGRRALDVRVFGSYKAAEVP